MDAYCKSIIYYFFTDKYDLIQLTKIAYINGGAKISNIDEIKHYIGKRMQMKNIETFIPDSMIKINNNYLIIEFDENDDFHQILLLQNIWQKT